MYYIDFNTGVGNDTAETLDFALIKGDEGVAYTQRDIDILDDNGNVVATRHWYGVAYSEDGSSEDPIEFGNFGFYADWIIY